MIGFQTPPFFCSAKKAPWLEKGQKAVAEQKSLLWDWVVGWGWDEHSARLVQTGARGWAYREHPHGPGSSWGSTPGLEGPVWLFQGSCIPQPSLHPSFHCKQQQSSSAVWDWDNAPWISGPSVPSCTGARLSPQPASLLLFPFFVVVARSFFWFCFFFFFLPLLNQFTGSSLIFPPCKLIRYSAPASTRKHPLSQGGLETPSLAVITLSSLTASQPAYKTFPFSPARGCPASQKKRKYSNISPPFPAEERKSCFSSPPSPFTSLLIQYFPSLLNRRERGQGRLFSDPFGSVLFRVNTS